MSKIALAGNASGTGTITLESPNTNSNFTISLPAASGTLVTTGGSGSITVGAGSAAAPSISCVTDSNTGIFFPAADNIAFSEGGVEAFRIQNDGSGIFQGLMTCGSAVVGGTLRANGTADNIYAFVDVGTQTPGGTEFSFTGFPSWAKRITVTLRALSVNGTDNIFVQVGSGGTPVTTGYLSSSSYFSATGATNISSSTGGFYIIGGDTAAIFTGHIVLTTVGSNIWVASGTYRRSTSGSMQFTAGEVTLGGTLDVLRIKTSGTNSFDASGSINVTYE